MRVWRDNHGRGGSESKGKGEGGVEIEEEATKGRYMDYPLIEKEKKDEKGKEFKTTRRKIQEMIKRKASQ